MLQMHKNSIYLTKESMVLSLLGHTHDYASPLIWNQIQVNMNLHYLYQYHR